MPKRTLTITIVLEGADADAGMTKVLKRLFQTLATSLTISHILPPMLFDYKNKSIGTIEEIYEP